MPYNNYDPSTGPNRKEPNQNNADHLGREGGDDALADARPSDPRADEKVIVNEQENNRIVNRPSQSELGANSDDVVND
ncbi:hypothetical protein SAMN05444008_11499 [Cnuella takakiae]|uniref:Uncharacterized protein n=1 Tax=Cnuella takakiae TaxID=1302690 RepID=A0A1M5FPD2_9BACT|nr:hypothetical protein [Cnuella takakiae]OLY93685.1 hypothetical protein BUE76_18715 [Cnuella takakiae]SHF93365.1 hypothetical protein SAMN05444008_11499 [Cnuella takakiae]